MNEKVAQLMPFIDFLGAALGSATEVVLHDLTDPDHSVVKIVNGHVSGRTVGAPATAFSLKMAEQLQHSDDCFVSDYVSTTADGRPLQSSSYFIRDDGGQIVGIICVNIDPQPFRTLEDGIKAFMEAYRHGGSEEFRDTNLDAVRSAYKASSVETLSIGGAETRCWGRSARRRASSTRRGASTSSAGSRLRAPSSSRARPQTLPSSCTSQCRASTATCSRSAARGRGPAPSPLGLHPHAEPTFSSIFQVRAQRG